LHKTITRAQSLIAVSKHLKETLIQMGASEDRIQVVGNGVNSDLFHPADRLELRKKLNLDPERKLALFVGNLDPVKGIGYALKALAKTPELDLVLIGQGSLLGSLKAEAAKLKISQRVTFALAKPHETVAQYMQASDFLLLPSLSEGEPNVILEALSTGRPVVASRVGGIPALMQDQEQGFLVKPQNPDELAKAFKKVIAKNFSEDALVDSVKDRSWQKSAERILKTMRETAGARH
jgi:glycosyltransferase involved in cell wall biosynthesis